MTTESLSKRPLSKRQVLTKQAAKVATYYNPNAWKEKGLWWTAGLFLITYLIVVIILSVYWSRSPGLYDVREQALSLVNHDESQVVTGTATATGYGPMAHHSLVSLSYISRVNAEINDLRTLLQEG